MFKSKRYYYTFYFLLLSFTGLTQTTYFVNQQSGNNANTGTTILSAFKAISKAIDAAKPGDTISIVGLYKNISYNPNYTFNNAADAHLWHAENSIKINNLNGLPNAYITIKAYDSNTKLKGDGANIFRVTNSSYLIIKDLNIEGEVPNIPISTANALQFVYLDKNAVINAKQPMFTELKFRDLDCISNCTANAVLDGEIYSNLSGINVSRPSYIDTRGMYLSNVHHIKILNNKIYNMPGGGLRVSDCEDISIFENEIFATSRKSYSGTHALVVTKATSTRNTDDYRILIERNKIHHNYNEQYSWAPTKTIITPHIDEGKGISLQRNETTYNTNGTINVNWEHGKILVANNITYFNGFSGIHSNDGNRIDIINNTSYFNSYTKSITENITSSSNGGNIGISAQGGSNIRIINNISIIDANLSKSAISSNLSLNDGLVVKNNIIYGTNSQGVMQSINDDADVLLVQVNTNKVNPLFVDPLNFNFSLENNSPAINNGAVLLAPSKDFNNNTRDNLPDIGAIEHFTSLNTLTNKNQIKVIYPNPTNKLLYIKSNSILKQNIKIFNTLGKTVKNYKILKNNTIDVSNLPKGIYILQVNNYTHKFLKK